MGNADSISEEMGSIFDELDSAAAPPVAAPPMAAPSAAAAPRSSVDPISLPESSPGDGPESASSISQQVAEFMPLNRRHARGNPALSSAEMERWLELREHLEYAFGSTSPPLGASKRLAFRVSTQLKVRLTGAGESLATLRNVSEKGGFIEVTQPPAPGTSLALEIETGDGGPVLNIDACARWSREIANMDGPAGVGVEFTAIEDSDIALLESVVEQSLAAAVKQLG
ncbi:MAG: PilZ domain-containing protein [Deltaproteobacteria bacterium]|nr:PilZ domain-containing protein [Deltaproteobacteria bacterium]MBW2400423.1 PilZ domain-containing protein [Deltaproteobacteria bacterium]